MEEDVRNVGASRRVCVVEVTPRTSSRDFKDSPGEKVPANDKKRWAAEQFGIPATTFATFTTTRSFLCLRAGIFKIVEAPYF